MTILLLRIRKKLSTWSFNPKKIKELGVHAHAHTRALFFPSKITFNII